MENPIERKKEMSLTPLVEGADQLYGEADNDELQGQRGDDLLYGGTGGDRRFGDADDLSIEAQGADLLYGGDGVDISRRQSETLRSTGENGQKRNACGAANDDFWEAAA